TLICEGPVYAKAGHRFESLSQHPWLLHCRALTCQSGCESAADRSSFQIGTTRAPHFGQGCSM
ncbi:hypothetical protein, partial [Arthrobacter oryzae]|uniref:hypothetical protein n=1 Tax=Arthrobacter oryzae TaxID=409290 RepID=UPI001C82892E